MVYNNFEIVNLCLALNTVRTCEQYNSSNSRHKRTSTPILDPEEITPALSECSKGYLKFCNGLQKDINRNSTLKSKSKMLPSEELISGQSIHSFQDLGNLYQPNEEQEGLRPSLCSRIKCLLNANCKSLIKRTRKILKKESRTHRCESMACKHDIKENNPPLFCKNRNLFVDVKDANSLNNANNANIILI